MTTFNLKIRPTKADCADGDYSFRVFFDESLIAISGSVGLTIQGGIAPYTWEMLSPGSTLAEASTVGLYNEVTCDNYSGDGLVQVRVTDACGGRATAVIRIEDYDPCCGCLSEDCAAAAPLTIAADSGVDLDAVVDGDTFLATGGVAPYRWRLTGGAMDGSVAGQGTIDGFYKVTSKNIDITVTVIDMCGQRARLEGRRVAVAPIIDSWVPQVGEQLTFRFGCDDDPRWTISCGEIDKWTGTIRNLDGCDCEEEITVTVDDRCSDPVDDTKNHDLEDWCD